MSNDLSEVIAAHEATNAKLLLRVAELEAERTERTSDGVSLAEKVAILTDVNRSLHREKATLREQVETLTKERDFAREEFHVQLRATWDRVNELDAAKADAARLRELISRHLMADEFSQTAKELVEADVELERALNSPDSAAWLESKIDERTALHVEREKSLEQQLVAATNDAARAELRARDLANAMRAVNEKLASDDRALDDYAPYDDIEAALAAAPDSDARLREVMEKAYELGRIDGWRDRENEERAKFADDQLPVQGCWAAVDEVLGVKS